MGLVLIGIKKSIDFFVDPGLIREKKLKKNKNKNRKKNYVMGLVCALKGKKILFLRSGCFG